MNKTMQSWQSSTQMEMKKTGKYKGYERGVVEGASTLYFLTDAAAKLHQAATLH